MEEEKLKALEALLGKEVARAVMAQVQATHKTADMLGTTYKEQQPATGVDAVVTWWMESHKSKYTAAEKRRLQEADEALRRALASGDRVAIATAANEWLRRNNPSPAERKTFLDFITGK